MPFGEVPDSVYEITAVTEFVCMVTMFVILVASAAYYQDKIKKLEAQLPKRPRRARKAK
jgi:hypothetical protein